MGACTPALETMRQFVAAKHGSVRGHRQVAEEEYRQLLERRKRRIPTGNERERAIDGNDTRDEIRHGQPRGKRHHRALLHSEQERPLRVAGWLAIEFVPEKSLDFSERIAEEDRRRPVVRAHIPGVSDDLTANINPLIGLKADDPPMRRSSLSQRRRIFSVSLVAMQGDDARRSGDVLDARIEQLTQCS